MARGREARGREAKGREARDSDGSELELQSWTWVIPRASVQRQSSLTGPFVCFGCLLVLFENVQTRDNRLNIFKLRKYEALYIATSTAVLLAALASFYELRRKCKTFTCATPEKTVSNVIATAEIESKRNISKRGTTNARG